MALLVGQEAEGSGLSTINVLEIPWAWSFTAAKSGKVNALHVIFSAKGTSANVRIALLADEAGKPGATLAEGEFASTEVGAHEVAVGEVTVTAGTVYWLAVETVTAGTLKIKVGAAASRRKSSTKHPKISEVTAAQWSAGEELGPVSIWASGTESGGESFSGSLLGAFGLTNVVKGLKVAASSLAQRIGVGGKLTGFKIASSSLTQPLGLRVILSGTPGGEAFAGQLLGFLALTGSIRGYKIASGEIREGASITPLETPFVTGEGHPPYLTLISGVSGLKSARGTLSSTVALRGSVGGARSSSGALKVLVGFRSTVTARKSTSGSLAGSVGLRVVISQEAPPVATVSLLFAGGGTVQTFYAGGGSAEVISAGGVSNELVYAGGGFE